MRSPPTFRPSSVQWFGKKASQTGSFLPKADAAISKILAMSASSAGSTLVGILLLSISSFGSDFIDGR